ARAARAHDVAVAALGAAVDHAQAAAAPDRVVLDRRALAVARLAAGDQGRRGIGHHDADDAVPSAQPDPAHAARGAAHLPYGRLVEADRLALLRAQHDRVARAGQAHAHDLVALAEQDGADPALLRAREGL